MSQRKAEQSAFRSAQRSAKQIAIRLLAAQLELARRPQEETVEGTQVGTNCAMPHASHEIQYLATDNSIIYCRICSGWSLRIKLKSLRKESEGLKDGNRFRLRLLEVGVAPYPGAKMPAHLSRVHCRGRRRSCQVCFCVMFHSCVVNVGLLHSAFHRDSL